MKGGVIITLFFLQQAASQVPGLLKRQCVMDFWGWLYIGDLSTTGKSRECQHWVTRRPMHKVDKKIVFYQRGGKLKAGNSCRNSFKDNIPVRKEPWCYTTDPSMERGNCAVPPCPERKRGCVTGMCMEYRGWACASTYSRLLSNIGCKHINRSGFKKQLFSPSVPKYLSRRWAGACSNPAVTKNAAFGRLTGPWCPVFGWPMVNTNRDFRWAPCELPLLGDKELTHPVHYTHAELETRLLVFWRLRSATVRFWLRAWSDYAKGAGVLYLTEFPGQGVAAVEIIIGWLNKQTKLCTRANGFVQERCVVKETPNIVSAEEWREFWVRLEAGMVELGYAGEGRPLIKMNADSVGNFAYIATANDILDPQHNEAKDDRRHVNMWAFQTDLLSSVVEKEDDRENSYCQEFSTVGPAWYSHMFKMKPLTDDEKQTFAGFVLWEDETDHEHHKNKMHFWKEFPDEMILGADIWIRAHPTGSVILLSTWPGVSDAYTVNMKIIFDNGDVHVDVHNCSPSRWMAECRQSPRSRNSAYRALLSTKRYHNFRQPRVKLSLTKWTRLLIVSQSKIFRIVTFDDETGEVGDAFSYDIMHFGMMDEAKYRESLKLGNYKNRESNVYRAYGLDDGTLEAHQARYIGFGTDGHRKTPPQVSFVRLHCRNGNQVPLTKYPNCIQDKDPISVKSFQGTWSVTKTGEQCTAWSALLDTWRMLPGDHMPRWGEQDEKPRKLIQGIKGLVQSILRGEVSPTMMDTANNCRNWRGVSGSVCFVKRYGSIKPTSLQKLMGRQEATKRGYWDTAERCDVPLCRYTDCRGTFNGQAYRGSNTSTGFLPAERCILHSGEAPSIEDWNAADYGPDNLCRNDDHRAPLNIDRPFCFVRDPRGDIVKRFCNSAHLCNFNPPHHMLSSTEIRLRLHSKMRHYVHIGARAVTPTIRNLGALMCFSDMVWDRHSNTVCVYIGNSFFLGVVVRFKTEMDSGRERWVSALEHATLIEVTSRDLTEELVQPQLEGLTFNWYWIKFSSQFMYIGRGEAFSPIMAVPYTEDAVEAAKRVAGNGLSLKAWVEYVGDVQVAERKPITSQRPPAADDVTHDAGTGGRLFSHLLLQGNVQTGTLFAFDQKYMRDFCPLIALQTRIYPPTSHFLNRHRTMEDGAREVLVEFTIRFLQTQTNIRSGFMVRLAEMANGIENSFQVYDVIFTHRTKDEMDGYAPVIDASLGDGRYALVVAQHRPSRDADYQNRLLKLATKYGDVENPFWNSFAPVHFIDDTADGQWHRLLIRVITTFAGRGPKAELHVEVPFGDDYKCIFKGWVHSEMVADIQFVSFSLLGGTRGEAHVMLDVAGDDCQPPTDDQLTPVVRDGGWGGWSAWDCSAECDGGFGSRQRLCNDPEPTLWGHDCQEWNTPRQFGLCNNHKCGTFSDDTRLRMAHSLANDPVSLDLREGDQFVLGCRTDAYQAALEQFSLLDTIWLRNGHKWQIDNNRMELQDLDVVVRNASRNDTGVYGCVVGPSDDSTGLVSIVAVIVRTGNVTRRAMTGDRVQFNCQGDLLDQVYDDLLHFWYLDGELYSYMGYRVYPDDNHTDLVLPKMDPSDPLEPRYIAIQDIRLQDVNETAINTMTMRLASERLSGEWECLVFQPKYRLLWSTNWFRLQVEPYDRYRRLTAGPVAQFLVGGVLGPILYGTVTTIAVLASLAGAMYWFVRRRQRRIQAQMVLFRQSGLWAAGGETVALLTDDSGEEEELEEEHSAEVAGGVLVVGPEEAETDDVTGDDTDDSGVAPPPPA